MRAWAGTPAGGGVLRVVDEIKPELVVDAISQSFFHLRAVPVGLPGQSVDIHHRFQRDHLAVEPAVLDRACPVQRADRPDQDLALRVDRLALAVPELVPSIHVRRRNLVAVIGLQSEIRRVVDSHFVASLNAVHHRRVRAEPEADRVAGHCTQGDTLTCGRAARDDQVGACEVTRGHAR